MKAIAKYVLLAGLVITCGVKADTPQVGDTPTPVVQNISVSTEVTTGTDNDGSPLYYYTYTVTNPAPNTGYIWNIQVDVSSPNNYQFNIPGDLQVPRGNLGQERFYRLVGEIIPNDRSLNTNVVPYGIAAPDGWLGSLTVRQTGGFIASTGAQEIGPGQTVTGLTLYSEGIPTIRTMSLIPDWMPYFSTGEASPSQILLAGQIQQSLVVSVKVLGPSYVSAGTFDHWNEFQSDVGSAISLGWITDNNFANTINSDLQAARTAMNQNGGTASLPPLQQMLNDIEASTGTQRNDTAYALLLDNVQAIVASIDPTQPLQPPPPSPKATFIVPTTPTVFAAVGGTITVTEQVVDQASNDAPLSGYSSPISINGPDAGQTPANDLTDGNGQLSVTITGTQVGTDQVTLPFNGTGELRGGPLTENIVWTGGPDLIVSHFGPNEVSVNGSVIEVTDTTKNIGNTPSLPSYTYYLMASSYPVQEASTFYVIDARSVPALQPGQEDTGTLEEDVTGLVPNGTYYLVACANWDGEAIETDYNNNCANQQILATFTKDANQPPVCTAATPSQPLLWPPNHQMVSITINGVTDPNNLTPTITITGIQQDEPVNSVGDGNTAPDGTGVGTSTAQVRSERSGIAQGGRLYFIGFSAADSDGGSCTGVVTVGVPHDKGQHSMPVDNGLRYDSTATQ